MKNITKTSRIVIALASLAMLGSYFFPLWRIDLWAPQYPEGLSMHIWHNKIAGDVDIINGLNHYIGMRHIKQEMFPEFSILPYLIALFVAFGLIVALVGKRRLLVAFLATMVLAALQHCMIFIVGATIMVTTLTHMQRLKCRACPINRLSLGIKHCLILGRIPFQLQVVGYSLVAESSSV